MSGVTKAAASTALNISVEPISHGNNRNTTPLLPSQRPATESLIYRAGRRVTPSMVFAQMASKMGKDIQKADSMEKFEPLVTRFEKIKRGDVRNGGLKLTEGLESLAYATPRFIEKDGKLAPAFTRALRVIEKWSSEEKAAKSLGGFQYMVDIANSLYKAWVDNGIRTRADSNEELAEANRAITQVLKKAHEFIETDARRMNKPEDLDKAKSNRWFTFDKNESFGTNYENTGPYPYMSKAQFTKMKLPEPSATNAVPFAVARNFKSDPNI
jgi:hypothetical protein